MTEDFTPLALAYLLGELDPAARAEFEARIETEPEARAQLQAVAEALGTFASSAAPAEPLPTSLRADMLTAILAERSLSIQPPRTWLRAWAWPLAASLLAAANLGQWGYHRWADTHAHAPAVAASAAGPAPLPITSGNFVPGASEFRVTARGTSPRSGSAGGAAAAQPSLRQTITFTLSQTMVTTTARAMPQPSNAPVQQGALELHNLPKLAADEMMVLWARRSDATGYEPVGEIPRAIYGGSGTINYHLRPGSNPAVHFIVTVEPRGSVPASPSRAVVCSGP